jgi:hypothetical protein
MRQNSFRALAALLALGIGASFAHATPYASGITVSGTTVNYITNEDSDNLEISINGGAFAPAPDGAAKGPHSFTIPSGATFSIRADRNEVGFTTGDGGTMAPAGSGLAYTTNTANGTLISDLNNPLTKFNSPRGVSVSLNPNAPNFGNVYISNSAASTTPPAGRASNLGDGVYALKADQTDGYGFGDTAQGSAVLSAAATANTPYKLTVAANGEVYVTGFGDAVSGVFRMPANLASIDTVLGGTTGPTTLPVGQNHGSVTATYVTGSTGTNDLTVYTLDEDMTSAQLTRANAADPMGTDTNKLWQYNIGGSALPYTAMPTAVTPNTPLIPGASIVLDVDRGTDGKWYLTQNRAQPANTSGLFVTDASGSVLFDSAKATAAIPAYSTPAGDYNHDGFKTARDYVIWRKTLGSTTVLDADGNGNGVVDQADYDIWRGGNPALTGAAVEAGFGDVVNDLYSNIFAVAVSPDQKWLAALHNNNTISFTPLVNGIPDVANILTLQAGSTTISARDIAWDAAGNLHMVSSGNGQYLVVAPGGHTQAVTSWNGSSYAFNVTTIPGSGSLAGGTVPEPGTLLLLLSGVFAFGFRRRR